MTPLFVYQCDRCNYDNDEIFTYQSRPDFITCQKCQSPAHLRIATPHFTINGANAQNRYSGDSNFGWIGETSDSLKK